MNSTRLYISVPLITLLAAGSAVAAAGYYSEATMETIPAEVKEYLSSKDSHFRAELTRRRPKLVDMVNSKETRTVLFDWLASPQSWHASFSAFTANILEFLRNGAVPRETSIVRPFLLHEDALVRLRAYEFLFTVYFSRKSRESMLLLLNSMLRDPDELVKTQSIRYIERAQLTAHFRPEFDRLRTDAEARGARATESYELLQRFLTER
jgi:hypothetical protein